MSRNNHETDYAAALENDYARWYELFTKGGFDPSWADGSNLNLVRNHNEDRNCFFMRGGCHEKHSCNHA